MKTKKSFSWNPTIGTASLLHSEEVKVLLNILEKLMTERLGSPTKGDFLLRGQRWNGCSFEIARCMMSEGHQPSSYLGQSCFSNDLTERAVNCVFTFPHHGYNAKEDELFYSWPMTGIYEDCTGLKALTLNCAHGRFLASCYADFPNDKPDATIEVLLVTALTLMYLRPHDRKLKKSCEEIWGSLEAETVNRVAEVSNWVTNAFYDSRTESVHEWRKWRRKWEKIAELPDYFDEVSLIPAAVWS